MLSSGTKIIFWDLREPFIENLYKHNVPQARLEVLIDAFDVVSYPFVGNSGTVRRLRRN